MLHLLHPPPTPEASAMQFAFRDAFQDYYRQAEAGAGMTEPEWLSSTAPVSMLTFLKGRASERKVRLFTTACARLLWDRIPPGELREAVEAADRCADGTPWEDELARHVQRVYEIVTDHLGKANQAPAADRPWDQLGVLYTVLQTTVSPRAFQGGFPSPTKAPFILRLTGDRQPDLIRDIFGNPFRPATADPRWLTPTVVALAEGIYADRGFDRLPILADALEDADCDNTEVLSHLRGGGLHVPGCWAVDLVLGRS